MISIQEKKVYFSPQMNAMRFCSTIDAANKNNLLSD